jgi:hypothetical protein
MSNQIDTVRRVTREVAAITNAMSDKQSARSNLAVPGDQVGRVRAVETAIGGAGDAAADQQTLRNRK